MSNLKLLRNRIQSIKSTQKITSAMKLVSSSYFRRAEVRLATVRTYEEKVREALFKAVHLPDMQNPSVYLTGNSGNQHLLIIVSADRGLCGGFNVNIARAANAEIRRLKEEKKEIKIMMMGSKSTTGLYAPFRQSIEDTYVLSHTSLEEIVNKVAHKIFFSLIRGVIDTCSVLYTRFRTVLLNVPSVISLVPYKVTETMSSVEKEELCLYESDTSVDTLLENLSQENIKAQLYLAIAESQASEQSARMMAMENATKNSKEMLEKLEILYNRTRQAAITKELIEIVSGAESV